METAIQKETLSDEEIREFVKREGIEVENYARELFWSVKEYMEVFGSLKGKTLTQIEGALF